MLFMVEATMEQVMATRTGRRAFGRRQAASPLATDAIRRDRRNRGITGATRARHTHGFCGMKTGSLSKKI